MKTQLLKHPAFRAVGLVLAVVTVCPAITSTTLYDTLGSPPSIRGNGAAITNGSSWSALAARFTVPTVSGPAAILTGFDLAIFLNGGAWNATIPGTLTVSIYRDSIGVPGGPAALGALVASTTFVNAQPVCVPGSENGVPDNCVPIFSATMPGNLLLTPGNYWLALTTSCACQVGWLYTNGGEGNAYLDPTTNLWGSLIDNPWGFRVYGTQPSASGTLTPAPGSPFPAGTNPFSMAVGDFNGDGVPDLVIYANSGGFDPWVLLGDGTGHFKLSGVVVVSILSKSGSTITVADAAGLSAGMNSIGVGAISSISGNVVTLFAPFSGATFPVNATFVTPTAILYWGPAFMAVGDFDEDGRLDLVITNQFINGVALLRGDGKGGFTAPGALNPVGSSPQFVAVGDFNRDSHLDFVTANSTGNVTVMLGDGTGKFTQAGGSPFPVGGNPVSVVVADFNGDGKLDLATANSFSRNVTLLLGDGKGGFTAAPGNPFPLSEGAVSMAVGDFDGNGKPDLAVASPLGYVQVLLNQMLVDGTGGFTAPTGSPFAAGPRPQSVTVGDFNGDGYPDLAIANDLVNLEGPQPSGTVTVLLGNGTGAFTAAPGGPYAVGSGPVSVVAADFNRDGRLDLATANSNDNNVTVLLGALAATGSVLSTTAGANIVYGTSVPLSLAVSNPGTFFNAPTGAATFMDGLTPLGTAAQTSSPYTFTATGLSAGTHTFTASYGGDARSLPSSSNTITIQVTNTAVGSNITVQPVDPTSGGTPVTLTFSSVTQAGATTVTTSSSGPPPPSGFSLGNPPVYYNLSTTAAYTPPITVCINYSGITFTAAPALFHFEGGVWTDVTTSVDTVNYIICGAVSSLSPFALFRNEAGIQALSPTAANALLVSGTSVVNISGEIAVNSNSTKAMVVSGVSKVTAKAVQIVGGFSAPSGAISPAPVTGAASRPDPLATLQPPSYSGCNFTNFKLTGVGSAPLTPGVYCGGITIAGNATATFAAGAYILNGGGLNVSGNASLSGQGLTFYNTGSGSSYKPVTISGSVKVSLSAPTSGAMNGILFFQDRSVSSGSANTLSGDVQAQLGGALYFPTTGLVVSGNGGSSGGGTVIIANTVEFSGNAYLR